MITTVLHCLQSEWIRQRRTPILWLVLIGGLFIVSCLFVVFLAKAQEFSQSELPHWELYFRVNFLIVSLLLAVPFIVLLASALYQLEHRAAAWKFLYTLPVGKGYFFVAKLLLALTALALTYGVFLTGIIGSGYLLAVLHQDFEFIRKSPNWSALLYSIGLSYGASLGVLGLQFWASLRWQHFLPPLGIGLLGFIAAAALLVVGRYDLAQYFPYAYVGMIGLHFGGEAANVQLQFWGGLPLVVWWSIGCFLLSSTLSYWEESRRPIH